MNKTHGSPYDRGSADAYYQRPRRPHHYMGATHNSSPYFSKPGLMSAQEIVEYNQGYTDQMASGDFKHWGDV